MFLYDRIWVWTFDKIQIFRQWCSQRDLIQLWMVIQNCLTKLCVFEHCEEQSKKSSAHSVFFVEFFCFIINVSMHNAIGNIIWHPSAVLGHIKEKNKAKEMTLLYRMVKWYVVSALRRIHIIHVSVGLSTNTFIVCVSRVCLCYAMSYKWRDNQNTLLALDCLQYTLHSHYIHQHVCSIWC